MKSILIIEDDPKLGPWLKTCLEFAGYKVDLADNGPRGLMSAKNGTHQLIILDLMLPYLDGISVLKSIREKAVETPVIVLTAKGTEYDKLEGFDSGCDDYMTKPFSLKELIARIRALLRRSGWSESKSAISINGIFIDPDSREVRNRDQRIEMTKLEFDLLYVLASHPNQALSRAFLINEVWGEDSEVTNRAVDTRILSLRRKVESDPENPGIIVTVYKVGYMWKGE